MHIQDALRLYARTSTFLDIFASYTIRSAPVLDDATMKVIDDLVPITVAGVPERIFMRLPEMCRLYFDKWSSQRTASGPTFKNFIYHAKSPHDGLLIGVGQDDVKYVLLVWDRWSFDHWSPILSWRDEVSSLRRTHLFS